LARILEEGAPTIKSGTPEYAAPELLLTDAPLGFLVEDLYEVDIWSVGVITYILLCGYPPFYGNNMIKNIVKAMYEFHSPAWDTISDLAKDFISKVLVTDPKKRPTAKECNTHPWFKC